jgi:hypothetical protein
MLYPMLSDYEIRFYIYELLKVGTYMIAYGRLTLKCETKLTPSNYTLRFRL